MKDKNRVSIRTVNGKKTQQKLLEDVLYEAYHGISWIRQDHQQLHSFPTWMLETSQDYGPQNLFTFMATRIREWVRDNNNVLVVKRENPNKSPNYISWDSCYGARGDGSDRRIVKRYYKNYGVSDSRVGSQNE